MPRPFWATQTALDQWKRIKTLDDPVAECVKGIFDLIDERPQAGHRLRELAAAQRRQESDAAQRLIAFGLPDACRIVFGTLRGRHNPPPPLAFVVHMEKERAGYDNSIIWIGARLRDGSFLRIAIPDR